jgi:ketosteroid isomerase-like protein
MKEREQVIKDYVDGYNQFDVDKMVAEFHDQIVFENIQGGEPTMSLNGLEAFREQAEQAKSYFAKRTQTIRSIKHSDNETEIEIDYFAVLAADFPNGLKKGQELKLSGKSIFVFKDGKVIKLTDITTDEPS